MRQVKMSAFAGKGELQMGKRTAGWRPEWFRAMALDRLRSSTHIGKLCLELGVSRSTLRKWRSQMESRGESQPVEVQLRGETLEKENLRLKQALAEKVLEVDFLEGALRNIEARRRQNTASGARVSTPRSGE
jgi:transposase-like protein